MKEQDKRYGYLLHNRDRRYTDIIDMVPVREVSMVFSEELFNHTAHSDEVELYQGNGESEKHAKRWLTEKKRDSP